MKTLTQNKNGNVFVYLLKACAAISMCIFFAACGGDSSSSEPNSGDALQEESSSSSENASIPSYESENDLLNCSKNREGEIVEVTDERKAYICEEGRWEFDHVILDSVKTEDDLLACLSKNEGDSVWVKDESAIFVCIDRKWEKQKKEEKKEDASIPTYKSEDDLPNCSKDSKGNLALVDDEVMLCKDGKWLDLGTAYETSDSVPNCTQKRDGKTAFILDEFLALVCTDGKWKEDDEVEEIVVKPETKSSSSGKSDGESSSSDHVETSSSSSSKEVKSSSSSGKVFPEYNVEFIGSFKDNRDGRIYKTVKIGNQVWFAENLNYDDGLGMCPMKNAENCEKYGRLYNFESDEKEFSSLSALCPDGWHIPDSLDWIELISYVSANNGEEPVGVSLKASTGWFSEGDSVLIEGNGKIGPFGTVDSIRVGATRGTNRFGFSALPAGSCWDDGSCYVGDDTRFFFMKRLEIRGGSYRLAFDKDNMVYSQDGAFGWVSVRCLQNRYLEIDSMPPVDIINSLLWMVGDLSYKGSTEFNLHTAFYACPVGWRLPTQDEIRKAVKSGKFTIPAEDGKVEYFAMDGYGLGSSVECNSSGACYEEAGNVKKSERRIRCVHEEKLSEVSECACTASEFNPKTNSITWTVNGCKENIFKISGYSWDFGSDVEGIEVSGASVTKTFDSFAIIAPSVSMNRSVKVDGKDYAFSQKLTCPAVQAGNPDADIVVENDKKIELNAGAIYRASLDGKCNEYSQYAYLGCSQDGNDEATIEIAGEKFSGNHNIGANIGKIICSMDEFSVKVSSDMECSISF